MSSDASSSYMDDSELELGLGLCLAGSGGGGNFKSKSLAVPPAAAVGRPYDRYCARISTAGDFTSVTSSSSSSSSVTERTAEPPPPSRSGLSSHVVGWPPIRIHRVNSLVNHTKSPATEEFNPAVYKCKHEKDVDNTDFGSNGSCYFVKQKRPFKASFLVKVNMDGFLIGRKVDMSAHDCYESLARTIDNMFSFKEGVGARRSEVEEQARGPTRLLGGLFDFVLTYEDKEGDWMLVGDVPWEMFVSSVKKLRITKTADANGLGLN